MDDVVKLRERGKMIFSSLEEKGVCEENISDLKIFLRFVIKKALENKLSPLEIAEYFGYFIKFEFEQKLSDILFDGAAIDSTKAESEEFKSVIRYIQRRLLKII